jgi:hypothetical protein
MGSPVPAGEAPWWRRRTAIIITASVLVSALTAGGIAGLAAGALHVVQQAGATVGSGAGVRYHGTVTDSGGLDTDLDVTVAADGTAYGRLQRPFGAAAEVGVVGADTMIKGNREWWMVYRPAEADGLAGKWIANPPGWATGVESIDLLTPSSLGRALAPPGGEPWTRTGDRDIDGRAGQAWSDGSRHVVVSADAPPQVLAVDVPLAESPYSLTLPDDDRTAQPATRDEHDHGLWEAQIEATVTTPTDDELEQLEELLGEVEELAGNLDEIVQQVVQDAEAPADRPTGEECRPRDEPGRGPEGEGLGGATGPPGAPAQSPLPDPSLPWQPPNPPPPGPGPDGVIGRRPSVSAGEPPPLDRTGPKEVIGGQPSVPLGGPPPLDPTGGVDFSSLELRYIRDSDAGDGLEYAFSSRPGVGRGLLDDPGAGDRQASDAFFVWLALPPSSFWVNLNPDEPDRITDPRLARTDVGRILLEADLEMKKVSARLLHPDTPLGRRFWASVEHYRDGICSFTRYWIVPGPATVSAKDGGLHILDAPLQVHAESVVPPEIGVEVPGECHGVPPSIVEHNETLERDLVRPEIERAVNESPEFAGLRRVYLSRVAAEWYRDRSESEPTPVDGIVDGEDVSPWVSRVGWSPREVFDRYVESLRNHELDVVREERHGDTLWQRRYIVGGVDWSELEFHEVDPTEIEARRPGITSVVAASFQRPTTDPEGLVWRGFTSELPQYWRESGWGDWFYVVTPIFVGFVAVGLPAWLRRRRNAPFEPSESVT